MSRYRVQCPMLSGEKIAHYLKGQNKRIYSDGEDVGDFVIVYNARNISVRDNSYYWKRFLYPVHTRFGRHIVDQTMEEVHKRDPCHIMSKEVRANLPKGLLRQTWEARLFLYPDGIETVPLRLIENVSGVIRQVMPVPKRLDEYSKEELDAFPKLFDWPEDFKLAPISPLNARKIKV
ncbi:54S ribosomal protein L13 [Cichlidogyrus casuarinus]|uniref:54S ribosomal protein L13 n=1 Tax=Cichlidogyrus casuarinus TaxID=1844966 RepID=A0ABD2QFX6_9PLAT